jgi:hypothetical protein
MAWEHKEKRMRVRELSRRRRKIRRDAFVVRSLSIILMIVQRRSVISVSLSIIQHQLVTF